MCVEKENIRKMQGDGMAPKTPLDAPGAPLLQVLEGLPPYPGRQVPS